jgi:hypothetical protein
MATSMNRPQSNSAVSKQTMSETPALSARYLLLAVQASSLTRLMEAAHNGTYALSGSGFRLGSGVGRVTSGRDGFAEMGALRECRRSIG